ncbi:histone H3-like centromeric protein A [Vipera latastei]
MRPTAGTGSRRTPSTPLRRGRAGGSPRRSQASPRRSGPSRPPQEAPAGHSSLAGTGSRRTPSTPRRRGRSGGSPRRSQASPRRSGPSSPPQEAPAGHRRRRKYRPCFRALQEIRKYQKSTNLLIAKLPFHHVVREICLKYTRGVDVMWQSMALLALQEAAEAFLVHLMEHAYLCTIQAKQVTLHPRDIQLAPQIHGIEQGLG